MTRLGLIMIVLVLVTGSCGNKGRPAGVMSKEDYAAFLVDVYLTEAKFSQLQVPGDSAMRLYLSYEPELLARNDVTDSIVKLTYEYYVSHPQDMQEVYAAVVDTLSLREQKANQTTP